MRFHPESVYFLVALLVLPLIWWRYFRRQPQAAVRFSSVAPMQRQPLGWAVRARCLIPILRTLTVALLIICVARPEKGNEQTRIFAEGIAIQMVVDLSGSMEARDFVLDRRRTSRLEAVKEVFTQFVEGAGELEGRPDDLIGLIGFARYADSLAPLTLDHENVLAILDDTETVAGPTAQARVQALDQAMRRALSAGERRRLQQLQVERRSIEEENQTAIGDALALAVERLRDLDRRRERARFGGSTDARKIKGKVIILLTDGESNSGDLTPEQAATLAKAGEVKVYTIGIGSEMRRGAIVAEDQMRRVAEETGGQYFQATDTRSLHEVYAAIDKLEKTKTEQRRFLQHTPLATRSVTLAGVRWPPLLLMVVILLALEILLSNTRLRQVP